MPTTERVRPSAVAGQFYPGGPNELRTLVDHELELAAERTPESEVQPKALIVPHAGYVYSGAIAASAYVSLLPWRERITRVVLLGPAHRVPVRSMALSSADLWETPLGTVRIDTDASALISAMPGIVFDDRAHAPEHSLEVHVPFLQRVLAPGFFLLPIVVGGAPPDQVADVLDAVWGGDETVIVISSDLSHFHDQATARRLDRATADAIVVGRRDAIDPDGACGAYPIRGVLTAAERHGLSIELVDLRNSGDTAGTPDRVVGYGSFVLTPTRVDAPSAESAGPSSTATAETDDGPATLSPHVREALLAIATEAIRARLEGRRSRQYPRSGGTSDELRPLDEPGATFVTLHDGERLLGCIGSLEARRPLADDVADNALGAAFRDPRLPALTRDEFERMSVHISLLTTPRPMRVTSLDDLRSQVQPGVDGLLIEAGHHRATFLPAVWEQIPDTESFLAHLWTKAGLRPGTWPAEMRVERYHAIEFGDDGPRPPIAT